MKKITFKLTLLALGLGTIALPALSVADDACVLLGALAWDNWTKIDAGGSGKLPVNEQNEDMVRCKSCHGWDHLGEDGGYVRRSRNATRPNAGAKDGDTRTRNVDVGRLGKHAPITAQMILHSGTGRSLAEGSGSWVELDESRSAANTAAYQSGYTLGNQHPDYSNLLTDKQVACLVEFLNTEEIQPGKIFKNIVPTAEPVVYQMIDTADAKAGKQFFESHCTECHGSPTNDQSKTSAGAPEGGFLAYVKEDGKFSELSHVMRAGIPDTVMTRTRIGNPTSQDAINVMKYLQELSQVATHDTCGDSNSSLTTTPQETILHIPKISVPAPNGLTTTHWATLHAVPELSANGNLVFELANSAANSGTCDKK